jgi:hypothetical protein
VSGEPRTARYTLRDARPDEAEAVGAVVRAAYAQFEPDYPPESWERFIRLVGEAGGHFEHTQVIVAEQEGAIAGTVTFYPDGSLSGQGEWPDGWAGGSAALTPRQRPGAGADG